ncbi:MAG: DNA gyrase subunit A, partial [Bacteroidales bacterium]|nr:DNA gyrase subunit A [Bacteroidales bacterium]
YELPEGSRASKGRAIQNMINIEPDDNVKAFIKVQNFKDEDYIKSNYIVLATKKGVIKKTLLEAYSRPRSNGIIAVNIKEGDSLLQARLTNGNNELLLAKRSGKAIRFHESTVRTVGRNASGVKGVTLENANDEVIGFVCISPDREDMTILVVSEKGYGKRTAIEDYRITNRGGKGVKTINITDKTGSLISVKAVTENDDLMIINRSGITIRLEVEAIRIAGRATQGVRLINLRNDDTIAAVASVVKSPSEEEQAENLEEGGEQQENTTEEGEE